MQKTYKTNRLIIGRVQQADAADLQTLFEDRELEQLSGLTLPIEPAQRVIAFQMMSSKGYIYVLRLLTSHELIGVIGFYPCYQTNTMPAPFDRELGYALKRSWWNQGLMTEACQILIPMYLRLNSRNTLHANVLPQNHRSLRVLEKNGFQQLSIPSYLALADGERGEIHLQLGASNFKQQ